LLGVCFFLGQDKSIQKKLQNEVDTILGNDDPTAESIPKLKYCKMVLDETLRLRPATTHLPRMATQDTEILGQKISKNTAVIAAVSGIHLNEEIWPNSRSFIPERFSDDNKNSQRHPFSFIPFSGGPRNCIGFKLAIQEATIILAMIVQNFEIETNDPKEVKMSYEGAVSPSGLKVKYISRKEENKIC